MRLLCDGAGAETARKIRRFRHSLHYGPAAGKSGFSDVADGAWYADAVAWAAEHGIVSGVGGGAFTPGGTITRE